MRRPFSIALFSIALLTFASSVTLACSAAASSSSATPTPGKTATPGVSDPNPPELPAVTSMRSEHVGAGAITVYVTTNVPTRAAFSVVGQNDGASVADAPTVTHATLLKEHSVSVGTGGGPVRVTVVATDQNGVAVNGSLEVGSILGTQFWGRGDSAPKLTMNGNHEATASWLNLKPAPGPVTRGRAILFGKKAACTTAEACPVTEMTTFDNDSASASADQASESHVLTIQFPDTAHDFELVLVGRPSLTSYEFYQFDVRWSAIE